MSLPERSINNPIDTPAGRVTPKKSGPKRKPLKERTYTPPKGRHRVEERHSEQRQIETLMFLEHHRVYDPGHYTSINGYRRPLQKEACAHFTLKKQTVSDWVRRKEEICNPRVRPYTPYWPRLEEALFGRFLEARKDKQKIITTGWFRTQARDIFSRHNPKCPDVFTFSNGWWLGFKRRWGIARRKITKQATRRPEDYQEVANSFCRFIRRVSTKAVTHRLHPQQSPKMDINYILDSPIRRFEKRYILNLDETPIPFEYLDGYTWDLRGAKTVAGKTDRSGWSKRQATLVLYIFADGSLPLRPKIIFHGSPNGRLLEEETPFYSPDVTVAFNETAYNNEELFLDWIKHELPSVRGQKDGKPERDLLLTMDVVAFHKTADVLAALRDQGVTTALIPPGCTSLVQPLDTAINRLFKDWLREETELYVSQRESEGITDWSVSDKRIMTTWVVARAAKRLSERPQLVEKAFLNCGISVRPDGTQDNLISIKDIKKIDFTGWEQSEDVNIKKEELVSVLCDHEEVMMAGEEDRTTEDLHIALRLLKNNDLKAMARDLGLPVSGNKKDLVERLVKRYTQGTTAEAPISL